MTITYVIMLLHCVIESRTQTQKSTNCSELDVADAMQAIQNEIVFMHIDKCRMVIGNEGGADVVGETKSNI